jgi:hypothetical protein
MDRAGHERALRASLEAVDAQRQHRSEAGWGPWVVPLKAFQQGRFRITYADLLAHPRWEGACRFFLDELYGPRDYAERDRGFARVVPALVRVFPGEVIETVELLLRLHAVSESLDSAMAAAAWAAGGVTGSVEHSASPCWSGPLYTAAWQAVGRGDERSWQVQAVCELGASLDRLVRQPGLRTALRMMRAPARLAGLAALQLFLETGFDTFRAMRGATEFLATVHERETLWLRWLGHASADGPSGLPHLQGQGEPWLGQFPNQSGEP